MIVQALGIGVLAGIILTAIYKALNHGWPERYFGVTASVDLDASRNMLRYAVFRLSIPLIVAAITVNTLGGLANPHGRLGVAGVACAHLYRNANVIRIEMLKSSLLRRRRKIIFQIIIIIGVLVSVTAGYFAAAILRPLTPEPRDLLLALWTAAAAGLGAAYVGGFVLKRADFETLTPKSLLELDQDLIDAAQQESVVAGINPSIPIGVMVSENIQRPFWVRQLERRVAKVFKRTEFTQGVMQIRNAGPLSDRDSVVKAIHFFADSWRIDLSGTDQTALWKLCVDYNESNAANLYESIKYVEANIASNGPN